MNLKTNNRLFCLMVLAIGSLGLRHSACGDTVLVNSDGTGDYPTIQAAIDASSNGDIIELADGVYIGAGNRNLDYNGKLICVRSASGNPESCILNCERQGRGFYFHSGEDLSAKVEGLTIRNGSVLSSSTTGGLGGFGGAVQLFHAAATFQNCRFVENEAFMAGALSVYEAEAVLHDCVIDNNVSDMAGGGVYCEESVLNVYHCVISRNFVWGLGGGIGDYGSDIVLVDVVFSENLCVEGTGGGVYANYTSLFASDCRFEKNTVDFNGGGLWVANGPGYSTLLNCQFRENESGKYGGGIYVKNYGFMDLIGCVVAHNRAHWGGGISIASENTPIVQDCTILNNYAEEDGGGIYVLPSE